MPKFDLTLVKGASYFFSGRLSVGAYIRDKVATLIDTGIDKDSAKGFDDALKAKGFKVGAIINTHHHPDHCGGNQYFQQKYPGVKIFATEFEKPFIDNPAMTPFAFFGGAEPPAELHNRHLEAAPSRVTDIIPYKDQKLEVNGVPFNIATLPGHSHGLVGVVTPDNVFYCGDAIFGKGTFDKHGVLLYTNIQQALSSFKKISTMPVDACVFYHGGLAEEKLAIVAEKHEQNALAVKGRIAALIKENSSGLSIDDITQKVVMEYKVPQDMTAFVLTRASVSAYITQLSLEKQISLSMQNGLLRAVTRIAQPTLTTASHAPTTTIVDAKLTETGRVVAVAVSVANTPTVAMTQSTVASISSPASAVTTSVASTPTVAMTQSTVASSMSSPATAAAPNISSTPHTAATDSKAVTPLQEKSADAGRPLHSNAQKVQNALTSKGFKMVVRELPDSTHTATQAAQAIGCEVGQIVKSLIFRTKKDKKPVLVLASGINNVGGKKIGQKLGDKIESAGKDFAEREAGFPVGGIPPVGHPTALPTFIDEDLLKFKELWAAAGTPNAVFPLESSQVQSLTGGTVLSMK
jgi:prolyl-tRNA editing enzyme YbaK/EbsC (Cys-tRNA(Pro) deacylase)/glyoxylase-like metal-dependent hydrolase (beta-lactamase superfamily II)